MWSRACSIAPWLLILNDFEGHSINFQFSSVHVTSYKLQHNDRGFNYNRASADRNSYTDLFSLVIRDLKRRGKGKKVQGCNVQFKSGLNQLSLSHEANKKREKNKTKNRWAIKSENCHKNPWDRSEKVRETMVGRIYGKVSFESGLELRCSDA